MTAPVVVASWIGRHYYSSSFAPQTLALGRVGVPDDIGPTVASLLGPDNRWVTAQRIEVSGGQNI